MMEMATWKRGYEHIPDVRTIEKDLGESRKNTSPLWKYLAIGAIPILICGIIVLAIFAGVLSLGLVILHERCPPAEIPVTRTYILNLAVASSAHNWTNRANTVTQLNTFFASIAANTSLVYTNANNPLRVKFNHIASQVYNRLFHEVYLDTPNQAIAATGASLRVRTYISSSGNGPTMGSTTTVEFIFRSGDVLLATDSTIAPSATQSSLGKQRLDYAYTYVSEYTSTVSRYAHHVEVSNVAYQYVPSLISDVQLLFNNVPSVLPNVAGTTPLNITSDHYVWEQDYFNDVIGSTDVVYPQTLETHIRLIYGSQTDAIAGVVQPRNGSLFFRMWMGNDGYGRWSADTVDQGMTLFRTLAVSSWGIPASNNTGNATLS